MNQILYTGEIEKNKMSSHKKIIILITILSISIIMVFYVYPTIFPTSPIAGMSQDEVLLGSLPQQNEVEENEIQVNITNEIVAEQKEEMNNTGEQTVTKKSKSSSGESYETIAIINIPSLNIEYPVLSSTSTELLKISLNKYWGANPNQVGNMCIVGHNYQDSRFFGKLDKIKQGAEVLITDMTGKTLTYQVYHTEVISPYDNSCTSQLTDGKREVTLITCHTNGTKRFIVKARECE